MDENIFIKNFFEKYYEKINCSDENLLYLPNVPVDMIAPDTNSSEEWKKWKLIPSTITESDIKSIELQIKAQLPQILKIFYTTYFHFFESPIGRHSSDQPFSELLRAWNPNLIKNGYLPFTWDKDDYMIRCFDLKNIPDERNCNIFEIDHETLFDLGDNVTRDILESKMNKVADNFWQYLTQILEGQEKNNSDTKSNKSGKELLQDMIEHFQRKVPVVMNNDNYNIPLLINDSDVGRFILNYRLMQPLFNNQDFWKYVNKEFIFCDYIFNQITIIRFYTKKINRPTVVYCPFEYDKETERGREKEREDDWTVHFTDNSIQFITDAEKKEIYEKDQNQQQNPTPKMFFRLADSKNFKDVLPVFYSPEDVKAMYKTSRIAKITFDEMLKINDKSNLVVIDPLGAPLTISTDYLSKFAGIIPFSNDREELKALYNKEIQKLV